MAKRDEPNKRVYREGLQAFRELLTPHGWTVDFVKKGHAKHAKVVARRGALEVESTMSGTPKGDITHFLMLCRKDARAIIRTYP